MTRKNKRLILASMAVYERRMRGETIDIAPDECPLCGEHWSATQESCMNCPIAEDGYEDCGGSPWSMLRNHLTDCHVGDVPISTCPTCQMLLWEEYNYLCYLYYCGGD